MDLKNKILGLLFLLCAIPFLGWSQGSFGPTFTVESATPCEGEEFCLDVSVRDFTDLTSVKVPFQWDTSVIEFVQVTNFNLPDLDQNDFILSGADTGLIFIDWEFLPCEEAAALNSAVTVDDDQVIFQLCFRVKADYGEVTEVAPLRQINLPDDPTPVFIQRLNVACDASIDLNPVPGIVSTCVTPLEVYLTSAQGNAGEIVSVDVKVRGIRDLNSMQFSINWDSTELEFDEVIPLETLVNLNIANFGRPGVDANIDKGTLTFGWNFTPVDDLLGATIPDDESIFTINFLVKGECETTTEVAFTGNPTTQEAINTRVEGTQQILDVVPIIFTNGEVARGACTPSGLIVSANCGAPVNLNDEVCVQVTYGQISDISDIRYLMKWNPNILQYKRVQNFTRNMNGLTANDFNTDNVGNGFLEIDWRSPGDFFNANFSEDEVAYEVCFDVVGLGGNSPFSFDPSPSTSRVRQEGMIQSIGLFPNSCVVEVNQPEGVTIAIGANQAPPGDTICLDVTGRNIQDIIDLQFSLSWEPNHVSFIEVNNVNPLFGDSLNLITSGVALGSFTFDWANSNSAITFVDDAVLFTLCLEVTGQAPGELSQETNCRAIDLINLPLEAQAITTTSNGNNIGVTPLSGEVCVLNPEGFFLVIENDEAFRNSETCIDFKVAEFTDITSSQFTINWDPTLLEFSGNINLDAIPDLQIGTNLDTTSASVGIIGFDWNELLGLSLPDSSVLFEICYNLVGPADECADIEINSDPNPSVTTLNGAGSVFPLGGGICIKDTLIITDVNITGISCPGSADGTIELTVEGGAGQVFYTWRTLTSTQFLPRATNLPEGMVAVTIFDNSIPALVTRDTFMIPGPTNLPTADAGEDLTLSCANDLAILRGTGTTFSNNTSFSWSTLGGNIGGRTDFDVTTATRPGLYILAVIDNESGCFDRDTVEVFSPTLPIANAGPDVFFTCADTLKTLDASMSTPLDSSITYRWEQFSGGIIVPGDETDEVNPTITRAGTYVLEVVIKETGCSATDTVQAISVQEFTPVSAGDDIELTCDTTGVTLFADIDNSVRDFSFRWLDENNNLIEEDDRVSVNTVGTYIIEAQDLDNLCITRDTVNVLPNSQLPVIDLIDSTAIDCNNPTVELSAQVSNTSNFESTWTTLSGELMENPDNPLDVTITAAGTFVLTVVDTLTSCTLTDTLEVANNIEIISIDAGVGGDLTCEVPQIILRATVDTSLNLMWTLDDQTLASDTDTLNVGTAGTYYLTATNPATGCANRDSVVVTSSADLPSLEVADIPTITCDVQEANITATVDPGDASYTFSWSVIDNGEIIGGTDALTVMVGAAGTYRLEATNINTGCIGTRDITIATDTIAPIVSAGEDQTLTCTQDSVTLNGIGSAQGSTIVYTWSAVEGGSMPVTPDALQTQVFAAGTYALEVRDTATGCSAMDVVVVMPDTTLPNVQIADTDILTCTMNMVSLDGTGSDNGNTFSAAWSALDGQSAPQVDGMDPLMASVTDAGNYQLVITNLSSGCENAATIVVTEIRDLPIANAGQDVIIICPGTAVNLDGSGSDQGENFTYNWTSLNGVAVSNPMSLAPSVDQPGQFELEVTNNETGCTNTATVNALLDPNLSEADAGQDDTTCDGDAAIFAAAPLGAAGIWTTPGAANIDIPDGNSTTVSNLQPGANIFVWTISTSDCPNYSRDSVTVTREQAPAANPDAVTMEVGATELNVNVAANDIISSTSGATVTILNNPTLGVIGSIAPNGVINYQVPPGVFGDDNFSYEICNNECATLCDTASVAITIPFDPNYTPTLVNGITPNGDGQNDELIFEQLQLDPEAFPDNELIIFNRWGDIVFEARPYTNNWQGTNSSGQDLPEGTYYYILRLNISEGNIIKGDITIIK